MLNHRILKELKALPRKKFHLNILTTLNPDTNTNNYKNLRYKIR